MKKIRVRFAPSPTGYVHVGNFRTALYDYLFAKQNNDDFIIRIEDTDRNRYVEDAVENLLKTLKWAGLDYDEGPGKDSPCGPFFQSERLDIYKKYIQILLNENKAYPCFCPEDRLDEMRKRQASANQPIMYDGLCRNIPADEARKRIRNGEQYVIRMRIPDNKSTIVKDIIRGSIEFPNEQIDDQVLIKSDGFPTYHFACVVDDHLMNITHVFRGDDWLPSAPKHFILYDYFGWAPPVFIHLPLLLNSDRSKLSKRQGDVAVEDYIAKGILPQALLNFTALLGWNPGDDREIFSIDELIKEFSLSRVSRSGAVFDIDKLYWMNGQYIRKMDNKAYIEMSKKWVAKLNINIKNIINIDALLLSVKDRILKFDDLLNEFKLYVSDQPEYTKEAKNIIIKTESTQIFETMLKEINNIDVLTNEAFNKIMKNAQNSTGIKGKDLWMPVRAALTGDIAGPELHTVIEIFGKEKVKKLLLQALEIK